MTLCKWCHYWGGPWPPRSIMGGQGPGPPSSYAHAMPASKRGIKSSLLQGRGLNTLCFSGCGLFIHSIIPWLLLAITTGRLWPVRQLNSRRAAARSRVAFLWLFARAIRDGQSTELHFISFPWQVTRIRLSTAGKCADASDLPREDAFHWLLSTSARVG